MSDFPFDVCIKSAQDAIDRETRVHEKRMEFWAGYKAAMEEVQSHDR